MCFGVQFSQGPPAVHLQDFLFFRHVAAGQCPDLGVHRAHQVGQLWLISVGRSVKWLEEMGKQGHEIQFDAAPPKEYGYQLVFFDSGKGSLQ